ncbi:MAG TPA: hypothetical protein VIU42_01305 [Xanthobacteraceae bacterium]
MSILIRTLAGAGAAAALALGATAFAGGDDYDAMNDTEGAGPAYFGFVRDHRGSPVSEAQVFLRPKSGELVALKTNVLGLYRSHINKDVKPEDVTISCEKSGYRQERVFRRTEPGAMFIETDCTLRRL